MNDPELPVTIDLEDEPAVTPQEINLVGELLPQLIKDLLAQQDDDEM